MNNYPLPAVGVFIFKGNAIYLVKKGRGIFTDKWITPGGKIEYGEYILDTVHREVKEETNLDICNIEFVTYEQTIEYDDNHNVVRHYVFFNFKANAMDGHPIANDDAAEIKLVPFSELKNLDINEPTIRTLKSMGIY